MVLIGDYNELLFSSKINSRLGRSSQQMQLSKEDLEEVDLQKIYMHKGQFTSWNRKKGDQLVRSKLDRSFGNFAFTQLYVVCCVDVILTISLDHHS